jgi:broad specificity phosphatase PhoE
VSNVYFITHPEVVVDPHVPVAQWKLSRLGAFRARRMLEQDWVGRIGFIASSSERKAVEVAEILAAHLALSPRFHADLGENDRSATGYLPREEFETTADLFFAHPDRSIRGWETARAAQLRIVHAIDRVLHQAPAGDVAVVAHGGVGALLMCRLKGVAISRTEDQPGSGGGNFFVFGRQDRTVLQDWTPIEHRS